MPRIPANLPAPLQQPSCQFKILFFAYRLVQPEQRNLNLFVTIGLQRSSVHKCPNQQVSGFLGDIKQPHRSRSRKMRNPGLNQMSQAVKLMFKLQVLPALLWKMQLIVGIQVSVTLLGRLQQCNEVIHLLPQPRVI